MNETHQIKGEFEFVEKFLPEFMEQYEKAEAKLPYHINVIDELNVKAKENAHTRILEKLLQQKNPENQKFEIFESFIQFIQGKSVFFRNIHVEYPEIERKEFMDLRIQERNKYAIIIENKIHNAPNTRHQLANYINKTLEKGYEHQKIYIIYLGENDPKEQAWGNGNYKEVFKDRYIRLSYKKDIYQWLKNNVLPDTKLKDKYLLSALEQYIDHLEGMFDLRNINNKMNMELQEFIKKEWGLNDNLSENYHKLSEKEEEIEKEVEKVKKQINILKREIVKSLFGKLKESLNKDYPDLEHIDDPEQAGVYIQKEGRTITVWLGEENNNLYCLVGVKNKDESLPLKLIKKLESTPLLITDEGGGGVTMRVKWLKSISFEELNSDGLDFIKKVIDCVKNTQCNE